MFGETAFNHWIKPAYVTDIEFYQFTFDSKSTWTGGWTSSDDIQLEAILHVDTPDLQFEFKNLALVQAGNTTPNPFARSPRFNQINSGNASLGHLSTGQNTNPNSATQALGQDLSTMASPDDSTLGSLSTLSALGKTMGCDDDTVKTGNTADAQELPTQEDSDTIISHDTSPTHNVPEDLLCTPNHQTNSGHKVDSSIPLPNNILNNPPSPTSNFPSNDPHGTTDDNWNDDLSEILDAESTLDTPSEQHDSSSSTSTSNKRKLSEPHGEPLPSRSRSTHRSKYTKVDSPVPPHGNGPNESHS